MRRTALRDSLSSRLISRRLWPCAFKSRTPLRISIGIMFAIPFDVVLKALEVSLCAREGSHQLRGDRTQHRQSLAHAADQLIDPPQVGLALAFGAVAQALARLLLGTLIDRLQKQAGMIDHPLANAASGLLIVLEPLTQLSSREPRLLLGPQQAIGMRSVGARQRRNHPRGRPAR